MPLSAVVLRADSVNPGIYAAVNISLGGICILSAQEETVGGFAAIKFALCDREVSAYSKVVWCRAEPAEGPYAGLYKVGLEFIAIDKSAVDLIEHHVTSTQQQLESA